MKATHQVADTMYHEEEYQVCFEGNEQECMEFVREQGTIGLIIVPIVKEMR